jgi:Domain of unknown function (DUF6265)
MRQTISFLLFTLTAALAVHTAVAAEKVTERTLKLSPGEKSPPATIADMRWLTGHWVGSAFGGTTEEIWTAPAGADMAGVYRLHKQGKTVFYEILALSELNGSLVLRLKHFNADLTGWEEKDEVRSFPLVAKRGTAMLFEGMTFEPKGDELTVYLAVEHEGKPVEEVTFEYRRVRD